MTVAKAEPKEEKKESLADLMAKLEKQVDDAQAKSATLAKAEAAQQAAQKEYSESVAAVEKLRVELNNRVGNLFGGDARVRIAS